MPESTARVRFCDWECHYKHCSRLTFALYAGRTIVILHDVAAEGQTRIRMSARAIGVVAVRYDH